MVEIEKNHGGNGEDKTMVQISLKTIGPSPPSLLNVPSVIKVQDLRRLIAGKAHLPIENLRLILQGNVLHDNKNGLDEFIQLNNEDSLIVAVKPKPPVKHIQDGLDEDDDEEDLKFQLPQLTSGWKRTLYSFLHNKLRLPDMLLIAIFSLSLKAWTIIVLWFIFAPVAHSWDLGPLYIIATGFAIIFLNLGKRQHGDMRNRSQNQMQSSIGFVISFCALVLFWCAYSIFNEDFRELPGTLNADRLDRDIRAGQF